jgi:hypothetical protein
MDSHSLFGIEASDFEVIAAEPEIELTYDCVREPEQAPSDSIFDSSFE